MECRGNITVVKIGGNVIDDEAALQRFVADFAALPSPKILIHGGGKLATRLAERLEVPTTMIGGRRVTDAATIGIVTMVYAGGVMSNAYIRAAVEREIDRAYFAAPAFSADNAVGVALLAKERYAKEH